MKVLPLLSMTAALAGTPGVLRSQEQSEAPFNSTSWKRRLLRHSPRVPTNLENTVEAAEPLPRRDRVRWNEYHGPRFTIRAGAGFLYDFVAFAQDKESKEQIAMLSGEKVRDFRFIMVMYDGPTNSWYLRQTGIMFAVPEIFKLLLHWARKRGFLSQQGHGRLRRWLGYSKKHGFLWNLGYFNDVASKDRSFSSYSSQEVVRAAWLSVHSEEEGTLIHLGFNFRYGKHEGGQLRLKSRLEAFIAPFSSTPEHLPPAAQTARDIRLPSEGSLCSSVASTTSSMSTSQSTGDPMFHGGEVVATWLITGRRAL